jgi:hypothetical protein
VTASSQTFDDPRPAGPLRRLWLRFKSRWNPAPIATADQLKLFVEQRAALIAQKCAIDYVRGKTGQASHALFAEKTFLDALEVCRWETFAVVLGDLLILVESHLRPHAVAPADRARLCDALIGLHAAVLAALPVPEYRAGGWGDAIDSSALRLRSASLAEPQQIVDIADHSARRLFDTLPIHTRYRELDKEPVYGSVRFRMVAVSQDLGRRLRGAEVLRQLLEQLPEAPL